MILKATHQKLRGKWLKILKGTPTENEVRLFNAEIRAYQGQKRVLQGSKIFS
ncbi:MAG: hypothetical protein KTR22_12040 [Flavobacteriaceae bacterium]|nr:hypothetical protein [Flavobacteriaceae bacterium]